MNLLTPTLTLDKLIDIDINLLKKLKVNSLLIDADNTLAKHGSNDPAEGVLNWIENMKANGYNLIILSNNFKKRVSSFAKLLNIPYVNFSMKPLPFGIMKAKKILNASKKEMILIGDQVFTDILGANIYGIKSILLNPLFEYETKGIKIKRKFENKIRKKLKKRGDPFEFIK